MSLRRPFAYPLVPLYAATQWLENKLRRKPKQLAWPVLSIGSLSAGGAGKTPVVIALARLLQQHGYTVDVLSRGYGREGEHRSTEALRVDLTHPTHAAHFGDEPTLIARRAEVPVWVGRNRFFAGQSAEYEANEQPFGYCRSESRSAPPAHRVHLLDNGFQHRKLARAVDIVLVTLEDLDDALLPAGNRREPLSALARADVVVVRAHERDRVLGRIKPLLREGCKRWIIRRQLRFESPLAVLGAGLRPLAFCAIARPDDFQSMVKAAGCGLVDTLAFTDHHRYTSADVDHILTTAQKLNISGFVTTEKDAVKLTPAMRTRLETVGPLLIAALDVTFGDDTQVLTDIAASLGDPSASLGESSA